VGPSQAPDAHWSLRAWVTSTSSNWLEVRRHQNDTPIGAAHVDPKIKMTTLRKSPEVCQTQACWPLLRRPTNRALDTALRLKSTDPEGYFLHGPTWFYASLASLRRRVGPTRASTRSVAESNHPSAGDRRHHDFDPKCEHEAHRQRRRDKMCCRIKHFRRQPGDIQSLGPLRPYFRHLSPLSGYNKPKTASW